MSVHISLLGERSIVDDASGLVRTRSARTVALVAYLVLHAGVPQSRQHLAAVFWPESTDAQALTNLRRELHTLRQVLGDQPALVVTASDLCWQDAPAVQVDVRSFARERSAALEAARHGNGPAAVGTPRRHSLTTPVTLLPGMFEDWLLDARGGPAARVRRPVRPRLRDLRARWGDPAAALPAARRRITWSRWRRPATAS